MRFLILFSIFLISCTVEKNQPPTISSFYAQDKKFCRNTKLTTYLEKISTKIQKFGTIKHYSLRITTNNENLYSFFIPPNNLIFSVKFLQRLPSEGSLAFVLLHEIAHDKLEHTNDEIRNLDQELAADDFAFRNLTQAGYQVEDGINTLYRYRTLNIPEIEKRIKNSGKFLRSLSAEYNIKTNSDTKEFKEFQKVLAKCS